LFLSTGKAIVNDYNYEVQNEGQGFLTFSDLKVQLATKLYIFSGQVL
jgi:hypothetical protein